MINEAQLEDLRERLESIERLLENFISRDAKLALKYALDDPNTAAAKAGIAIEGLLGLIYRKIAEEKGEKISEKPLAINDLKGAIGKIGGDIPPTIMRNIDLIQQYRNEGSHSRVETLKSGELGSVLSALLNVLVWYLEEVRKEKLDFSEIGLKSKEKQYIDFVTMALADGVITETERKFLDTKIRELSLPVVRAKQIEDDLMQKYGKTTPPPKAEEVPIVSQYEDNTLNRREVRVLEDCHDLIFQENKPLDALPELESLIQKYPQNKQVSELYVLSRKEKDGEGVVQYLKGIKQKSFIENRLYVELLGESGDFNSAFDELEDIGKKFSGETETIELLEAHLNLLEWRETKRSRLLDTAKKLVKDKNSESGYAGYVKTLVQLGSGEITMDKVIKSLELYYRERLEDPIAKAEKERGEREAKEKEQREAKEKAEREHQERESREKAEKERLAEEQRNKSQTPKTYTNSLGMEFILIPAGEFMMGAVPQDKEADDDEKPQHKVRITKPFYLGKYPVTQGEWELLLGNNPSDFKNAGKRAPVECVSWKNIQEFIKRLNQKEGKTYRLPREAEWEYAARAGTSGIYTFEDDASNLGDYAWYDENSIDTTHPVGGKKPNNWGLYDMMGNVWEWCEDWFSEEYYGKSEIIDPKGSTNGKSKVVRGGSWAYFARDCRVSDRADCAPGIGYLSVGFRLLLPLS